MTSKTNVPADAIEALREALDGRVCVPGDAAYDEARDVWNARFVHRPDVVIRCETPDDVARGVALAREQRVALSVKSGGHSYAGKTVADGGVLLDMSPMTSIRVDSAARTVEIGAGVTCGALDAATQAHGLATPLPTVSTVGVVGAALGGGSGYLSRAYGLTIDNVAGIDVVTADGRLLHASADEHADLFWALRGAGANFGVVTSMRLRLHDVGPQVLAGQVIYPFDDASKLLRAFRAFMAEAPETLQCYPFMFRVPPLDVFPARYHGQPALDFVLCHLDAAAGDAVKPLQALGDPILDVVGPMAWTSVQQAFDANLPKGQRYFSRAHDLAELSDAAIETAVTHVREMQGAFSAAYFDPMGGAIGRPGVPPPPFGGRDARYGFHVLAGWIDPADDRAVMSWAQTFHEAMAPHATGGVYVNVLGDGEDERVAAAYGGHYARLAALKREWDPDNLFRMNANIAPDAGPA